MAPLLSAWVSHQHLQGCEGLWLPPCGQAVIVCPWVSPGVHHGLLGGGWSSGKTPLRL